MNNLQVKNELCATSRLRVFAWNRKTAITILATFFIFNFSFLIPASAKEYADSTVYQGMMVKLDLGNTVLELARSKAQQQSYEFALSWDLQHRFFPTFEAGYALAKNRESDNGLFSGQGAFAKIGLDLATLKKNRKYNQLLIGLRLGTCANRFDLLNYEKHDAEGQVVDIQTHTGLWRADIWGEVCGTLNVNVAKNFYIGWAVRMKFLFTRKPYHLGQENESPRAYYIPGYGYYEDSQFGLNYYIGFKF